MDLETVREIFTKQMKDGYTPDVSFDDLVAFAERTRAKDLKPGQVGRVKLVKFTKDENWFCFAFVYYPRRRKPANKWGLLFPPTFHLEFKEGLK